VSTSPSQSKAAAQEEAAWETAEYACEEKEFPIDTKTTTDEKRIATATVAATAIATVVTKRGGEAAPALVTATILVGRINGGFPEAASARAGTTARSTGETGGRSNTDGPWRFIDAGVAAIYYDYGFDRGVGEKLKTQNIVGAVVGVVGAMMDGVRAVDGMSGRVTT
jgi:hypothetical protein